ncbi:hypothetical protein BC835DRAFT_95316 [Cytidiella melzeri]|nr:hypothetical protein BC835DRAFT_95316 [Cytidiella melzeri]
MSAITTEMMDLDQQLAQLLGTMTLQGAWNVKTDMARDVRSMGYATPSKAVMAAAPDECMSDSSDAEDSSPYQANAQHLLQPPLSSSTPSNVEKPVRTPSGCALLQATHDMLCSGHYPTTGGAYLELIFTHREILYACPQLHRDCAMGFSDLAQTLERRDWRADREGDGEAVAAFRYEAGLTAHVASPL